MLFFRAQSTKAYPPPRYKLPSKRTEMNMIYYDVFWSAKRISVSSAIACFEVLFLFQL